MELAALSTDLSLRVPAMKKSLLELDPQADALLILQCPNAQKITSAEDREAWDSGEASQSETTTPPQTDENNSIKSPTTYEDLRSLQPYLNNGDPNMIQFQVSTRHLCIVSPVFRAMIEGRYRESQPNSQGILEIGASDWNAEAFLILLDIIHGHHREVPRQLNLEIIAQVRLLVNYYDCLEIVQMFFDSWCSRIDDWATYSGPFEPPPANKAENCGSREIILLFIA
ncbi:hypothetical protein DER44DRAFT_752781 [Fusarium oxysporum]|nr:hypothetical protein DER44DRAFT_752781 [Fusarium oxysporum]